MAITILIPDASIFLHAILAISNFAGLKLFLWWNRSRFTLSADGLIGGRIFLVLEGRQIYLSSDDDLFLCEVLATDFLSLFDDIPLNFRSFLAIEIDHDTSLILAPTEVDNCFLTIRVVPQEGVVRRMAIGGRSMIVGPFFEYVLGDNSSFQLPVLEYWRTVYIVRNNIRHVRVILRATEVSFAAESFLSLTTVAYSRFLTRYNGLSGVRLENGVCYARFYLATVQVDSYYWASYSSRTVTITQMGNGSDIRFHLGIGYIGYRFL